MDVSTFLASQPYSPQTNETYSGMLSRLALWMESKALRIEDLTPEILRGYMLPEWSSSYRYLLVASLRSYLRWAGPSDHPILKMRERRTQSMPGRTLSSAEASRLIAFLYQHRTRRSYRRSLAMVMLAYEGGLRASELCNITLHELDLERRLVYVRRKGGRQITSCRFRPPVAMAIRQWLRDREAMAPGCDRLFVTDEGTPMDRGSWRLICRRLAGVAGIDHFSPHSLRRAAACRLSEAGASDDLIMSSMGWSDPGVMRLYTRLASLDAIEDLLPSASLALPADFMAEMGA